MHLLLCYKMTDKPLPDKPLLSIVMPAHNAAGTIGRAIESLYGSRMADWELVVCDDCSTDATAATVARYADADPRIRLIATDRSLGSAYRPRKLAVQAARGEWILELDADDRFDRGYLDRVAETIDATGADMLIQRMARPDHSAPGSAIEPIPAADLVGRLAARLHSGRELMKYTLRRWQIPLYLIVRRELYMLTYADGDEPEAMNADELLSRRVLLKAEKVAFCDTTYLYNFTPDSVTNAITPRRFDVLDTSARLLDLVETGFGAGSEEYALAADYCFSIHVDCMMLPERVADPEVRKECARRVDAAMRRPQWRKAQQSVSGPVKWLSYLPRPLFAYAVRLMARIKGRQSGRQAANVG